MSDYAQLSGCRLECKPRRFTSFSPIGIHLMINVLMNVLLNAIILHCMCNILCIFPYIFPYYNFGVVGGNKLVISQIG